MSRVAPQGRLGRLSLRSGRVPPIQPAQPVGQEGAEDAQGHLPLMPLRMLNDRLRRRFLSGLDVERGRDRVWSGVEGVAGRVRYEGVGVAHPIQEQDLPRRVAEGPRTERACLQGAGGLPVAHLEVREADTPVGPNDLGLPSGLLPALL
jgi:hypothetical protein